MASREDGTKRVEDMICGEMALETAYEGNRFYDLMRFAFRRGEDFPASRVARRDDPDMPDQALYDELKDRETGTCRWRRTEDGMDGSGGRGTAVVPRHPCPFPA